MSGGSRPVETDTHYLNMQTIAADVEDSEQLSILAAHGCEGNQGFLYSEPMGAEEFSIFMQDADTLENLQHRVQAKDLFGS